MFRPGLTAALEALPLGCEAWAKSAAIKVLIRPTAGGKTPGGVHGGAPQVGETSMTEKSWLDDLQDLAGWQAEAPPRGTE
jgi:hypothetical protein